MLLGSSAAVLAIDSLELWGMHAHAIDLLHIHPALSVFHRRRQQMHREIVKEMCLSSPAMAW